MIPGPNCYFLIKLVEYGVIEWDDIPLVRDILKEEGVIA